MHPQNGVDTNKTPTKNLFLVFYLETDFYSWFASFIFMFVFIWKTSSEIFQAKILVIAEMTLKFETNGFKKFFQ